MEDHPVEEKAISREEYIQTVLRAYRQTPGTTGTVRRPDRVLAAQLQERGVPLAVVENALVLVQPFKALLPVAAESLRPVRHGEIHRRQ